MCYCVVACNASCLASWLASTSFDGDDQRSAAVKNTPAGSATKLGRYPIVHMYLAVERRSYYHVVNLALPGFFITAVGFCVVEYGVDGGIDSMGARLGVSLSEYNVRSDLQGTEGCV